ncbi:MAG: sigma-70 family RNA polymerase sigma factor [bacterium]|nr:sigma-70 family RNA polymerase sigma factor [bacterium]
MRSETKKYKTIDVDELLSLYREADSEAEKNKIKTTITSKMIPIVKHIAHSIARRSYDPIEDLIQAGFIGLLKAIDRYDYEKNDNFKIYAGYYIIGEMKHYLRDKLDGIKIPRHIQELAFRINTFTANLTYEEMIELTSEDVASALQIPKQAVDIVMMADRRKSTISFEDIYENSDQKFEEFIGNKDFKEKAKFEDEKIMLNDLIKILPTDYSILIKLYYNNDMSKTEIAEYLGWNVMKVSRTLERAFKIIYNHYNALKESDNIDE